MKTINVELEPELIKETISALNTKAHKIRIERTEKERELETILSRIKSLEAAISKNAKTENLLPDIPAADTFKRLEIAENGERRPYGATAETIFKILKAANGKPLKMKQIVDLSGAAYGSAYRILRGFEKEKMARRDKAQWSLI